MASILDQARQAMTPEIVRSVGSLIGESPSATSKGFASALPTVLAGVMDTASTTSGAERVRSMISDGGYGGGTLSNLGNMLTGGSGTDSLMRSGGHLLSNIFGSRTDEVSDAVARSADVPRSSATKLLALGAPIIMGILGREIGSRGLDTGGLMSMLTGERSSLTSLLPAGIGSLLGFKAAPTTTLPPERDRIRTEPPAPVSYRQANEPLPVARAATGRWWPAIAAALAALALLFLFTRPQAPRVAGTDQTVPSASPRQMASVQLPTGEKLSVREGGFLQNFNTFLADKSDTNLPKRFVFDDLNFETGTATLTAASGATVDQLATLLKAYPSVNVTLEGHTDATGDAAANKQLSEQRAEAVKAKLVQAGIGAERISTGGFGQERPLATNDTEEGRARNRRTELVVMSR
jgi:OmpA-OmpF porin, OOP family